MRNDKDIIARNKGGLETKYHSFFSYVFVLFLCFWGLKNICSSLFCASNDMKNVQFGFEMKKNLKMFSDRVSFGVRLSTLIVTQLQPNCNSNSCTD